MSPTILWKLDWTEVLDFIPNKILKWTKYVTCIQCENKVLKLDELFFKRNTACNVIFYIRKD